MQISRMRMRQRTNIRESITKYPMKYGAGIKGKIERRGDKFFHHRRDDVRDEWRCENVNIKYILKSISMRV